MLSVDIFWLLCRRYLSSTESFRLASTCKMYYNQLNKIPKMKELLIAGYSVSVVEANRAQYHRDSEAKMANRKQQLKGKLSDDKFCNRCYCWIRATKFKRHVAEKLCGKIGNDWCEECETTLHVIWNMRCFLAKRYCFECKSHYPLHNIQTNRRYTCVECKETLYHRGTESGCRSCGVKCFRINCVKCKTIGCRTFITEKHFCTHAHQWHGDGKGKQLDDHTIVFELAEGMFTWWYLVKCETEVIPIDLEHSIYSAVVLEDASKGHPILRRRNDQGKWE